MNLAELEEEFGGKVEAEEACDPCLLHPIQRPLNLAMIRQEKRFDLGMSALPVVRFPRDSQKETWSVILVVDDETGKAEYKKLFGDGRTENL